MIRLTDRDGNTIYVAPENIVLIYDGGKWTGIDVRQEEVYAVTESSHEVARMVLEYKLAMERYKVGLSLEKPHLWDSEQDKLFTLAGLETSAEKAARELLAGLEDTNDV